VAKEAAANINESAKQIHQTIAEATGPDKQGVDAAANIDESLTNLNTATANMADGTDAFEAQFLPPWFLSPSRLLQSRAHFARPISKR
jgi:hypothetical protein